MSHKPTLGILGLVVVLASCAAPAVPSVAPVPSSTTASVAPAGTPSSAAVDWHDPDQPAAARAMALLAEMTLDEKIGQMTQLEEGSVQPHDVTDLFLGSVLSGGGGAPLQNDADGWYRMVATYQDAALETRLAIPMLYGVDAVHGHNNVIGATIFPHNVGLGAAHDPALVTRIGQATAAEMIATGIRWDFGPVVAVPAGRALGSDVRGLRAGPGTRVAARERVHHRTPGSRPERSDRGGRHGEALPRRRRHRLGHLHDARLPDRPGRDRRR